MALLRRQQPGDAERAREMLDDADATLRRLGLVARADRLQREAATQEVAPPVAPSGGRCRYIDGAWELEAGGERARIGDSVGMRHLARLLAAPGHDFAADELAGAAVESASAQDLLDETALRSYRKRAEE